MATLGAMLGAMQAQVSAVTATLAGLTIGVGIDWPPVDALMANVRGTTALVTVFDRKLGRNTTRWAPIEIAETVVPATLTSTVSNSTIPAGGNETITLGGTVTVGDAVSCVLTSGAAFISGGAPQNNANPIYTPTWAQVVVSIMGDTPTSMATKLAAAINGDSILSGWVLALASGPVVTLYSLVSALHVDGDGPLLDGNGLPITVDGQRTTLGLQSVTGNGGTRSTEIGRRNRELQVVVWAPTIEIRDTVGDAIETMLQQMEAGWGTYPMGLALPDGTGGRVLMVNDYFLDNATTSDTYRRDFLVNVEAAVTTTDNLYAVLAQVTQFQPGYDVPAG